VKNGWAETVAPAGALWVGLRDAVGTAKEDGIAVTRLHKVEKILARDGLAEDIAHFYRSTRALDHLESVCFTRVADNVRKLAASAREAAEWRGKRREASSVLDGPLSLSDPGLPPWVLFWLEEADGRLDREVGFALWDANRQKTFLAYVGCSKVAEAGLIESPEMAVRPLGADLLQAVQASYASSAPQCGVLWRIRYQDLREDASRHWPIIGGSLSLASHVAFDLLQGGRVPDQGCVVIGGFDGRRAIKADDVDSTELEKINALMRQNSAGAHLALTRVVIGSDTAVTASNIAAFAAGGLTVQTVETVDAAVEAVSGVATGLLTYLDALITKVKEKGIALPGAGRKLVDVDIPRDVIAESPERRIGPTEKEEERRKPWRDARVEFAGTGQRLAVLLAPSGSGKSQLVQTTLLDMAATAQEALRAQEADVDSIALPLELSCETLAKYVDKEGVENTVAGILAALIESLETSVGSNAVAANTLKHILRPLTGSLSPGSDAEPADQGGVWLILDGFDQVTKPAAFKRGLEELLRRQVRIVMTSRETAFKERSWSEQRADVYQLATFNGEQIQTFLSRWFMQGTPRAVEDLLKEQRIREMAGTPFLLTLVCSNSDNSELAKDPCRTTLYRVALQDLASRCRVAAVAGAAEEFYDDNRLGQDLLSCLGPVVWSLFGKFVEGEEGRESIQRQDLLRAIEGSSRLVAPQEVRGSSQREKAIWLLDNAVDKGIFCSFDLDSTLFHFPHRSIGEYLAAIGLGEHLGVGTNDFTEFVSKLENTKWHDALIMAVGELASRDKQKAGALVERILADQASLPESIILVGEGVADGGAGSDDDTKACVPPAVLVKLRKRLLRIMRTNEIPPRTRAAAGKTLGRIGDPRFSKEFWHLPVFKPDLDENDELVPEEMLGFIEIPAGEFWMGSNLPPDKEKKSKS